MSETETEPGTVVGSAEVEENTLTLHGVDRVKTGTVQENGRLYLYSEVTGEHVKYALIREGTVASLGGSTSGTVTMNDVDVLDHGKVLSNGALYVGSWYAGEEVTVAVVPVEEGEVPENRPQNDESQD